MAEIKPPAGEPRLGIGAHPALTVVRMPGGRFVAHAHIKPILARVHLDQATGDVHLIFPPALVDFVSYERLRDAEEQAAAEKAE